MVNRELSQESIHSAVLRVNLLGYKEEVVIYAVLLSMFFFNNMNGYLTIDKNLQ